MASLTHCTVRLRNVFTEVPVLHDITVTLPQTGIVGLLGPNGAGKTTLLRVLAGYELGVDGVVDLPDLPILVGDRWRSAADQSFASLAKHLSRARRNFDLDRAHALLKDFGVPARRHCTSRGQTSAGLAALALAARAPLTLLDEPILGMDAEARQLLARSIIEEHLIHPRCWVIATHLIDEAADLFEQVIVMNKGRILKDSSTEELLAGYRRVQGPMEAVCALEPVGPVESIAGKATAIVAASSEMSQLRTSPVGLQELVTALTHRGEK